MSYNELYSLGGGGVITDDANATASQILSGYTAYVKGKKVTGNIQSQGAQTITPGTSDKTIASGKYLSGTQTIKGDTNLVAGNIKKGTSIFGVSGTFTSDANASAGNILSGKTAYVNGSKITGSMVNYANGTPNAIDAVRLQNNRFEIAPARGYHGYSWEDGNYSYLTYSQVANTIGLTAAKIAKGNTILGIAGTYTGYGKTFYGTTQSSSSKFSFTDTDGKQQTFPILKITGTGNIIPVSITVQQVSSAGNDLSGASDKWNFNLIGLHQWFPLKTSGNFHWEKNDVWIPVPEIQKSYQYVIFGS